MSPRHSPPFLLFNKLLTKKTMNMKKVFLLGMLFAATVCNAQVVLWDGTDKEVGSDGGFWSRAEPTVVDEEGNSIMKFTMKANPGGWGDEHHNAALPVGDVDFKSLRRLTMRLKMTDAHNVLVQLEGKEGAYNAERIAWYDGGDGWKVLVYEFAAGPDFNKITDSGNNVLAIWPFEKSAAGEGKTFYVDDIKLEGTMVNDKGILAYADNSLTGEVKVTGVIGKGTYQCTWAGDWHAENYDDYALLAQKLAPTATKLDVSEAGRWDEDWTAIQAKCPGITIVTEKEADGISAVKNARSEAAEYFDLQGRRIAEPTKGLYIVNGRKVVVK